MRVASLRFLLNVIAIGLASCVAAHPQADTRACAPPQAMREGWSASFIAGCTDRNGRFAGGSQIIHLVPHQGSLYAASGYWEDRRNVWYGGKDPNGPWAQVLRLSGSSEPWTVDLDLGPQHLRPELLKSVTFTRDAQGRPLATPDTLLIAATFDGSGSGGISVFVRNDEDGSWVKTKLISGNTGKRGEDLGKPGRRSARRCLDVQARPAPASSSSRVTRPEWTPAPDELILRHAHPERFLMTW